MGKTRGVKLTAWKDIQGPNLTFLKLTYRYPSKWPGASSGSMPAFFRFVLVTRRRSFAHVWLIFFTPTRPSPLRSS